MPEFNKNESPIKPADLTPVEAIIPDIKPPLPLEPKELYKPVRSADYSSDIRNALRESKELQEFFHPFSEQVLVEIGPGEVPTGYQIAALSDARAYIGVEPYNSGNNLRKFLEEMNLYSPGTRLIPRTVIKADALSFLKRLPDRSVSIFASQMESVMVESYEKATEREISRVLHPKGAFIQYDSRFKLDSNVFDSSLIDEKIAEDLFLDKNLEKYQLRI